MPPTASVPAPRDDVVAPRDPGEAAPLLSVVMPVRDVEDRVTEAVWSVLHQSMHDLELIVVDDGSSDATTEVVSAFEDARMRVVRGPGEGAAAARDHGAELARGTYLAFADGDGIVPEHGYDRLVGQAERSGSAMVVGNHVRMSPQRLVTRDETSPAYGRARERIMIADEPHLLRDRMCWNRVLRRSAWRDAGLSFSGAGGCVMTEAYRTFELDVVPVPVYIHREPVGPRPAPARPEDLEAYAAGELECHEELVRRAGAALAGPWFQGVLESAAWDRTLSLLAPDVLADERYDRARTLMARLVRRAPEAALLAQTEVRRLTYGLVAHEDWRRATTTHLADGAAARAALAADGVGDFVRACLAASPGAVGGAVARVIRVAFLEDLAPDHLDALPDDALMAAVTGAREAVAAGLPQGRLAPRERLAITAPVRRGPARVREHLRKPPPPPPSGARRLARKVVRRARRLVGRAPGANR